MKTVGAVVVLFLLADAARAQQPASAVSPNWDKPPLVTKALNAQCGPEGQGGDAATNHLKNRTDESQSYHAVTFQALTALPNLTPPPKPGGLVCFSAHIDSEV